MEKTGCCCDCGDCGCCSLMVWLVSSFEFPVSSFKFEIEAEALTSNPNPKPATRNSKLVSVAAQKRVELAGMVQRRQVVESADVRVPDVDLRHGAPARLLHHFRPFLRLEVDPYLVDRADALGLEQPLGHAAERAHAGGIHRDFRHWGRSVSCCFPLFPVSFLSSSYFSSGRLACCHAAMPPLSANTPAQPCLRSAPLLA